MFRLRGSKGSAQVVEMSFVLPAAMAVVVALMYLAIYMFLYVYAYSVAEVTADSLSSVVGQDNMYWQLKKEYVKKSDSERIVGELEDRLSGVCIVPGLGFEYSYVVGGELLKPEVEVKISETFLKKPVFTVHAKRSVCRPVEFADNTDVFYEIYDSLGAGKEIELVVNRFFGGG